MRLPECSDGVTQRGDRENTDSGGARGTVAAIVVTYNRKELLVRCLDSIFAQTRPVDRVILVDNCSTDGTPEFLSVVGCLDRIDLEYVRLRENAGGAGGFYEGMKRAYDQGYDWLWTMDDDGLPQHDTLAKLLECPPHILFRGCSVISDEDPAREELAFGFATASGLASNVGELQALAGETGVVEGHASPFNGVLVSREVVRRVGLPRKELFIWGDEIDYLLRTKRAGISIGTVLGARFSHPSGRDRQQETRFGLVRFRVRVLPDDPFRCYVLVRNSAYLQVRYRGPWSWAFLKLLAYPLVFPRRAGILVRALRDGVIGRLLPPEQARIAASKFFR